MSIEPLVLVFIENKVASFFLPATSVNETWQNGYTSKAHMMIESKNHVDIWSRLDQSKGESVHIGELLIMKAANNLSNPDFHLVVWAYYLKKALIFQRILQGEPS